MKINESKEKRLRTVDASVHAAQKSVAVSKSYMNALNMGNEHQEEEDAEPENYLTKSELRIWNRMSDYEKTYYLQMGEKAAARGKKNSVFAEEKPDSGFFRPGKRSGKSGFSGEKVIQLQGAQSDKTNVSFPGGGQVNAPAGEPFSTVSSKGAAGVSGAASAVGGPAVAAADIGKKTADKFREHMMAQAMSAENTLQSASEKCKEWGTQSASIDKLPGVVRFGVASVGAGAIAILAAVIQAAISVVAMVGAVLIAALLPIIIVVCIMAVVISMLSATLSESQLSGRGTQIVEVALSQEGNDGSVYWNYTMGSEYIDGTMTPWCACFVSWCANECGYLDSGLFPKSGSVSRYKSFFESMGLYHDAQDYIPKTGDLIIFARNEHIGIVQYVESGRVITIEGNASNAVHTRSYSLGNENISGYCTPEYPQSFDASTGSNVWIAYQFFRTKGCSPAASAGILGNLMQESGVDPMSRQADGPGRGICQWGGTRLQNLKNFAQERGRSWQELEVQLEFLWHELNGGESTCVYILNRDYGGLHHFMNATDISWAVEAFEKSFERAGQPMMERRIQYAFEIYEQMER